MFGHFKQICNFLCHRFDVGVIYEIPYITFGVGVSPCGRPPLCWASLLPFYKNTAFPMGMKRLRIFASLRRNSVNILPLFTWNL